LSNFEIEDAVKSIGLKNFRGVFLRDTLPKKPKRNNNNNNDILLRTHGPYHRHKNTKMNA